MNIEGFSNQIGLAGGVELSGYGSRPGLGMGYKGLGRAGFGSSKDVSRDGFGFRL